MTILRIFITGCLIILVAPACADCGATGDESYYHRAANARYSGIEELPIGLRDGLWEGPPYAEGGASRPRVGLMKGFIRVGDLDRDGSDDAIVVVWQSTGGSGTFNYVARLEAADDSLLNTATAPLGDRVKVEDGAIEPGRVRLEVLEHGPNDAACCPTLYTTRIYDEQLRLISKTPRETQ